MVRLGSSGILSFVIRLIDAFFHHIFDRSQENVVELVELFQAFSGLRPEESSFFDKKPHFTQTFYTNGDNHERTKPWSSCSSHRLSFFYVGVDHIMESLVGKGAGLSQTIDEINQRWQNRESK